MIEIKKIEESSSSEPHLEAIVGAVIGIVAGVVVHATFTQILYYAALGAFAFSARSPQVEPPQTADSSIGSNCREGPAPGITALQNTYAAASYRGG